MEDLDLSDSDSDPMAHETTTVWYRLRGSLRENAVDALEQHAGGTLGITDYTMHVSLGEITQVRIDLVADRSCAIIEFLDNTRAHLHEFVEAGQLEDAQIAAPDFIRAFYGYERSIWDTNGRFKAGV